MLKLITIIKILAKYNSKAVAPVKGDEGEALVPITPVAIVIIKKKIQQHQHHLNLQLLCSRL